MQEIYSTRNSTFQVYLFHYSIHEVCGHLKATHDQLVLLGCLVTYKNKLYFHNEAQVHAVMRLVLNIMTLLRQNANTSLGILFVIQAILGFKFRFQSVRVLYFLFFCFCI